MDNVTLIDLDVKSGATRGSLIALEQDTISLPFELKRVYYIYGVPTEERRGKHAHRELKQLLVCMSGSCKVEIKTEAETKVFDLSSPDQGLLIAEPVWREMFEFSEDCVLVVFASEIYQPEDYIWDFNEFVAFREMKY